MFVLVGRPSEVVVGAVVGDEAGAVAVTSPGDLTGSRPGMIQVVPPSEIVSVATSSML